MTDLALGSLYWEPKGLDFTIQSVIITSLLYNKCICTIEAVAATSMGPHGEGFPFLFYPMGEVEDGCPSSQGFQL